MKKTERERIVQAIMDTIQSVYGDATQTVLDERAAWAIWRKLEEMGVASPTSVAMIVAAAGGEVRIPDELLTDPPQEYSMMDDFKFGKVLRTRTKAAA